MNTPEENGRDGAQWSSKVCVVTESSPNPLIIMGVYVIKTLCIIMLILNEVRCSHKAAEGEAVEVRVGNEIMRKPKHPLTRLVINYPVQ